MEIEIRQILEVTVTFCGVNTVRKYGVKGAASFRGLTIKSGAVWR